MRTSILSIVLVVLAVGALQAQAPAAPRPLEGSLSVHALRREDASKTWPGGGFGLAWNGRRVALAGEGTITRRDGHNDWHALAGPRVTLGTTARTRLFLQVLAGAVIRQKESRLSGQLGGGIDVTLNTRTSMRVQLAGLLDKTGADSVTNGRLSLGFVIR